MLVVSHYIKTKIPLWQNNKQPENCGQLKDCSNHTKFDKAGSETYPNTTSKQHSGASLIGTKVAMPIQDQKTTTDTTQLSSTPLTSVA